MALTKIELKDIEEALADLEAEGLMEKTGEFRKGRPVYRITELGLRVKPADVAAAADAEQVN